MLGPEESTTKQKYAPPKSYLATYIIFQNIFKHIQSKIRFLKQVTINLKKNTKLTSLQSWAEIKGPLIV